MFASAKIWFLSSILSIIASTSYSNVIPAAIIRRHTVTYKDVPVDSYKPVQHPVVYVPSSMSNLLIHFRSKSSQVHLRQVHKSNVGQVQHTVSQDEPHYLRHEINKPVIQTIREVIVPYRQVVQEVKPVVEEVKTVVSSGVPKSSVYMNFGSKYTNPSANSYGNYQYVMNTNHDSTPQYNSADNGVTQHNSDQSPTHSSNDNLKSLYDLSSIYGIKPTVEQLSAYLTPSKSVNQNDHGYSSPLVYGLTNDIQTDPSTSIDYGYQDSNSIGGNSANNVQNMGYDQLIQDYHRENNVDVDVEQDERPTYRDNNNYYGGKANDQNYNYVQNIEPQYYVTENNGNPKGYYYESQHQSQHDSNSRYVTQNVDNSGYSQEYSGDLATSDGSAYGQPSSVQPFFGQYSAVPITKSTTLGSLAELMSGLPYQYSYESDMNVKRNA